MTNVETTNDESEVQGKSRKRALFPWLPWILIALFLLVAQIRRCSAPDPPGHIETSFATADFPKMRLLFGEYEVQGTVLGANGGTVYDALVYLRADDTPWWTRTDEAGHFELDRLPLGPWKIFVIARGHVGQAFEVECPEDASQPIVITLQLDRELPEPPTLPTPENSTLKGRIEPSIVGGNLAGFEVYLRPLAPLDEFGAPFPRRALTDEFGRFQIENVRHGEFQVVVLPPWAVGGSWPDLAAEESQKLTHPQPKSTYVVPLSTGAVSGRLTDLAGEFAEGALVLLERIDDPGRIWPPVTTGEDGAFRFDDLPLGDYQLRARAGAGEVEQRISVRRGTLLRLDLDPL